MLPLARLSLDWKKAVASAAIIARRVSQSSSLKTDSVRDSDRGRNASVPLSDAKSFVSIENEVCGRCLPLDCKYKLQL